MTLRALFRALVTSYLRRELGRTILTAMGVALGVAVLVAIDLANESAIASFKNTVRDVAGSAELTVRGNGSGLSGEVLELLAARPEVVGAAPLIMGNVAAGEGRGPGFGVGGPGEATATADSTETLLLLGVDLLRTTEGPAAPVRDLTFTLQEGRPLTDFLARGDLLMLTERYAIERGLKPGDTIMLTTGARHRRFTVGALLGGSALADANNGRLAVVDLAVSDDFLGRGGLLDRVDLTLREGTDRATAREALAKAMPATALVELPEQRNSQVDSMLAAFRFNLRALGHISILVGASIIFNTMSVAVVRRRPAIGTVRALGVKRGAVRAVFLLEGALLGLGGSLVGVVAGIGLASLLVRQVSDAISLNFVPADADTVVLRPGVLALALVLGTVGSMLAALRPASEAAATPPANTMRRTGGEAGGSRFGPLLAGAAVLATAAGVLLAREPRPGLPIEGYTASLLLIGAFVLLGKPFLALLCAVLRRPFAKLFHAEGLLAIAGIRSTLGRSSVAVTGLLISLGMAVSVSVMIASFRGTVVTWMEQVLVADFYVSGAPPEGTRQVEALLPIALADEIAALPGVDRVDPFRTKRIVLGGREANLGAGRLEAVGFTNKAQDGRPVRELFRAAARSRRLVVSEAFARKHGVKPGDSLPIPTPRGVVPLEIAGVYFDYSSEQGFAIMDRELFLELFADTRIDSIAVYLKPGVTEEEFGRTLQRVVDTHPGLPGVHLRANGNLRTFALEAFDRTFSITYVLQVIAILVSILGVTTTLLAQLLDRRHEIATLRFLGATHRRIVRLVVLETTAIALAGALLGVVAGIALSWILTRTIMMQSFGWTIEYTLPWLLVARIGLIVFAGTLLAAILPAREALRFSARSAQTPAG